MKSWQDCNICCRVCGAEQGTDHDQNRVRKEALETYLGSSVSTMTVVELGLWDVVATGSGRLLFDLLQWPDSRRHF